MFGIVTLVKLCPARSSLFPTQPAFQRLGCDVLHLPSDLLSGRCQCAFLCILSELVKVQ